MSTDTSNPLDTLFGDDEQSVDPPKSRFERIEITEDVADPAVDATGVDLDLSIDLGDMDLDAESDRTRPLEVTHQPITGEVVCLLDVDKVVRHIIEVKSQLAALHAFESELRKAALHLSTGETKTRRLTATVDGEMRTLLVNLPDDEWPQQELGVFHAWCSDEKRVQELGPFFRRFVREKPKVERSPIKKEVKKLAAEVFPEGSLLAEAKRRLLSINKGAAHKLPRVTVEGEKLATWEQGKYGDDEE